MWCTRRLDEDQQKRRCASAGIVCVALFYYTDIGESFTVPGFPQRRAKCDKSLQIN